MMEKRRCPFCFKSFSTGRPDRVYCEPRHRVAYDRREEYAPGEGERQRLLYEAQNRFISLAKVVRDLRFLTAFEAKHETPNGENHGYKSLAQTVTISKQATEYLTWVLDSLIDSSLTEANDDELSELLNLARIDGPTDDDLTT